MLILGVDFARRDLGALCAEHLASPMHVMGPVEWQPPTLCALIGPGSELAIRP